jgi:hypothetical protein
MASEKVKTECTPEEQEAVRLVLGMPGMKVIARELKKFGRDAFTRKQFTDPFEHPGKYYEYDAVHRCITVILPLLVEGLANYQADAPDKQVIPQKKFKILELFLTPFKGRK